MSADPGLRPTGVSLSVALRTRHFHWLPAARVRPFMS
jgi:hypothetical protein